MAACNVTDVALFLFSGRWVYHGDDSVQLRQTEHFFDVSVVLLLGCKLEQLVIVIFIVAFDYLLCGGGQRNTDCYCSSFFRLSGNVLNCTINDIVLRHFPQIRDTATNQTLKNKDVSLPCEFWAVAEIMIVKLIPFFNRDVIGRTIHTLNNVVFSEWVVCGLIIIVCPNEE